MADVAGLKGRQLLGLLRNNMAFLDDGVEDLRRLGNARPRVFVGA